MENSQEHSKKLIEHLRKQAIKSQTGLDRERDYIEIRKSNLLSVLKTCRDRESQNVDEKPKFIKSLRTRFRKPLDEIGFEKRLELELMRTHQIKSALYNLTADSLGGSYNTETFDSESYSLGLAYDLIARKTDPFTSEKISAVAVSAYVTLALQAKLSANDEWQAFAAPYLARLLVTDDNQLNLICAHFPLLALVVSEDPQRTAHELILKHYQTNSLTNAQDVLDSLINDRIRHTRVPATLFTSMYALPPLSYIPLEIIYLSTLIDFSLPETLQKLKAKLLTLPTIKDEAVLALEQYHRNL